MPNFRRKINRLPSYCYIGPNWYFITACTVDRLPRLSEAHLVESLLGALGAQCAAHSIDVYAYCFMPDHLHLELVGLAKDSNLAAMMKGFKGEGTSIGRRDGIRNLWEKGFHDHILRPTDNANAVAWYIFQNPVRKGLVKDARDWPNSGSWMFDWKKAVTPPVPFVPPW